jgi:2-phosphosulfolactate phosphatase
MHGAELAGRRRQARYSLAPASYLEAPAGLRCVLPSPNGAQVTLAAARTPSVVLAGSLRNARAVADAAQRIGSRFNVIPAGERWLDGSLRPALEDALGAGAVLASLPAPVRRKPTRRSRCSNAIARISWRRSNTAAPAANSGAGTTGTSSAGELDVSPCVARFDGVAYVAG